MLDGNAKPKSVSTTHVKYDEMFPYWKLARDCMAGKKSIHKQGELYLPRLSAQTDTQYLNYKKRAHFYNASWRTISILHGLLFRKEPSTQLPAIVETFAKDISMRGVQLDKFASEFALEMLITGFVGILVDYPQSINDTGQLTLAKAETIGLRPTLQLYVAESILNWKFRTINNKHTLSMLVVKEVRTEPDGEFAEKNVDQYRVFDLDERNFCRVRVYEINDKKEDVLVEGPLYPLINNLPLSEIPFFADFDFEQPPLDDLFETNIKHYQVSADYYHALHFSALPTMVITGYSPPITKPNEPAPQFLIGSESAITLPNAEAKAEFLEFRGSGLTPHETELGKLENQMANLGVKMLANEKSGVEAYKTVAARNAGEQSVLSNISIQASDMLEKALTLFSAWAGVIDNNIEYRLNREFLPVALDAQTMSAYLNSWKQGILTIEDLFDLFKRADLIASEKTIEDHKTALEAEAPSQEEIAAEAVAAAQPKAPDKTTKPLDKKPTIE